MQRDQAHAAARTWRTDRAYAPEGPLVGPIMHEVGIGRNSVNPLLRRQHDFRSPLRAHPADLSGCSQSPRPTASAAEAAAGTAGN